MIAGYPRQFNAKRNKSEEKPDEKETVLSSRTQRLVSVLLTIVAVSFNVLERSEAIKSAVAVTCIASAVWFFRTSREAKDAAAREARSNKAKQAPPEPPTSLWLCCSERFLSLAGQYDLVPGELVSGMPYWSRKQEDLFESYLYAAPDKGGWCITADREDMLGGLGNMRSSPNPRGKMPDEITLWSQCHNGLLVHDEEIAITRDMRHRHAGIARQQIASVVYKASLESKNYSVRMPATLWCAADRDAELVGWKD